MPWADRLIRQEEHHTADATDPIILRNRAVPEDEVWLVERYSIRLATDEAGLLRSFVSSGETLHFLREWPAPANPFLYIDDRPFHMGPGESLAIQATTLDSGDILEVRLMGIVVWSRQHGSMHDA